MNDVVVHGHWGRPLLAFPAERGNANDWQETGMVDAVRPLVDAGRVKLYCVTSYDSASWRDDSLSLEERARRHGVYEHWVCEEIAPWIRDDCAGRDDIMLAGCSFGAYHAANFALKRGDAVYFNNPMDYVAHLQGDHLDWLRSRASLLLVCGQGRWEDTTGALDSTRRFAALLAEKGLRHELDLWGHDVPHDWPSWRAQLAHHLPRFT